MKRASARNGIADDSLNEAFSRWCEHVEHITLRKHQWLFGANILLLMNSVLSVVLLLLLPGM